MEDEFSPQAMIKRFQDRARAVKTRGMPPVEGPDRQRIIQQTKEDFMDFAMLGDAVAKLDEGILTLTIDLRAPN